MSIIYKLPHVFTGYGLQDVRLDQPPKVCSEGPNSWHDGAVSAAQFIIRGMVK